MFKTFSKRVLSMGLAAAMVVSSLALAPVTKANAAGTAKEGWNLDIYMSASNLETNYSAASEDLIEMMAAKNMPENVQITVQTGGAEQWHYDTMIKKYYKNELGMTDETIAKIDIPNISNQYIQRWNVKYDNTIEQDGKTITYPSIVLKETVAINDPALAKEKGTTSVSMGEASTLADFVADSMGEYEHNMIVFWNHGGGTAGGVCYDDLSTNNDRLMLDEIDAGFKASIDKVANHSIDMVGFDACLMGNFESMAICAKYAQYMTGSFTLEGDDGWEYTDAVTALGAAVKANKSFTGGDFGKALINPFIEHYTSDKNNGYYYPDANLAVVDLSYAPKLVAEFDNMAKASVHLCSNDYMKANFIKAGYKSAVGYRGYCMTGLYTYLNNTMSFAKSYINKNATSKNEVIAENVKNAKEFVDAATILYNDLFNSSFFLAYFTGHPSSSVYKDHAFGFFLPDPKNNRGTKFSRDEYEKLGISKYHAIFCYMVAEDVMKNQNIKVTTDVSYNKKANKYTLSVTSKNGEFTDATSLDNFVMYNKKWTKVRSYDLALKDNKVSSTPWGAYLTFNGSPISMSPYDEEYFEYTTVFDVNGKKKTVSYDFDGEGGVVVSNSFKAGDVITPILVLADGSTVLNTAKKYTVKASDINEDGDVTLPFKYNKIATTKMAFDYYVVDMLGEEHHNFFAHANTLAFTNGTAKLAKTTYYATGKKICPAVTVKTKAGKTLKKGTDYKLVYSNNLAAGTATVQVIGIGNYKGAATKTLKFTIKARA